MDLWFYVGVLRLWASSGTFPLSAHLRLYKRGRNTPPPPTNPSYHLKKDRSELPLKWLHKEDRRKRPTAPARPCVAATIAASPCCDHIDVSVNTAAATTVVAAAAHLVPPPPFHPSPVPSANAPQVSHHCHPKHRWCRPHQPPPPAPSGALRAPSVAPYTSRLRHPTRPASGPPHVPPSAPLVPPSLQHHAPLASSSPHTPRLWCCHTPAPRGSLLFTWAVHAAVGGGHADRAMHPARLVALVVCPPPPPYCAESSAAPRRRRIQTTSADCPCHVRMSYPATTNRARAPRIGTRPLLKLKSFLLLSVLPVLVPIVVET